MYYGLPMGPGSDKKSRIHHKNHKNSWNHVDSVDEITEIAWIPIHFQ